MRIFRAGSYKNRKLRKQNSSQSKQQHPTISQIPSIGSELAASDQFEIVVAKRDAELTAGEHRRKSHKGGFLSYFGNDNDDSTVSSITTVEYGGFFHSGGSSRRPNYIHTATTAAAESISSWCCCGESDNTATGGGMTRRTHPTLSSTDNTLIQHSTYGGGGTLQPSDSRSQQQQNMYYRSMNGSRCCGIDGSIAPIKRQRSFLFSNYWGRHRNNNNGNNTTNKYNGKNLSAMNTDSSMKNTVVPNMSASLFDDLSEDELDLLHIKRSTSFSVGRCRTKKNQQQQQQHSEPSTKPISLRRVLTWKRSKVL